MNSREEFEAWWKTFDFYPDESELDKDPDGYYFDTCTGRMWAAWQSARASQWISASQDLPDHFQKVWVKLDSGDVQPDPYELIGTADCLRWMRLNHLKNKKILPFEVVSQWSPVEPPK